MNKMFLTSEEVFIVKGYLSSNKDKVTPINNEKFITAQTDAKYIITFAEMAKGKDFKGKEADSLFDLKSKVAEVLSEKGNTYVKVPEIEKGKLTTQLADEAMSFIKVGKNVEKANKVNNFLQKFNTLQEFKEIGLFFEEDIVKIDKIYTIDEVVKAVESVIDLLD